MPKTAKTTEPADAFEGTPVLTVPDALDDIPEPVTPPAVLATVPLTLDQALWKFSEHTATLLAAVEKSWAQKLASLTQQQPLPYGATVHVQTPAGYPMTMSVQAGSQDDFLARMGTLMAFLQDNGFGPGSPF